MPSPRQPDEPSTGLPNGWIERLFGRMVGYYGARFADAWRGCDVEEVKRVWSEELAQYSGEEIRRGIDRLRDRPFPPTLPEFLALCRPKPVPEAAHAEACRLIGRLEGWSDCAVFWAAREIGYHDLKVMPYQQIRGRWVDALDRHWSNRKPIPEPAPVAGVIARDAGPKEPPMTEEQKAEVWRRIREFGARVKAVPRAAPEGKEDMSAVRAAEQEIAARGARAEEAA